MFPVRQKLHTIALCLQHTVSNKTLGFTAYTWCTLRFYSFSCIRLFPLFIYKELNEDLYLNYNICHHNGCLFISRLHTVFDPQWLAVLANRYLFNWLIFIVKQLIIQKPFWASFSVFSCSGWSHAHLQCSCSHRHHRVRHPWPRSDVGKATTKWGLICHPQPPGARQDGRRVQGLWEHVWTHARHLPWNIRFVCVCVCGSYVLP